MNYALFHFINQFAGHHYRLDQFMIFCARDLVWFMILAMAFVWFGAPRRQPMVFYACLSAAVALMLAKWGISGWIGHPRPFADHAVTLLIRHKPDPSFPSKHASFVFGLAAVSFHINRKMGWSMLACALLTGLARIYVGVHYPGDIAGGALLGALIGLLIVRFRVYLRFMPDFLIRLDRRLFWFHRL